MKKQLFLVLLVVVLALAGGVLADVPGKINIQGRLLDNSGNPRALGNCRMSVQLNNRPTEVPGTIVWQSADSSVFVDANGFFSAEFAYGTPDLSTIPFNEPYFMEISINGDPIPLPITVENPRMSLYTAPYAFTARNVSGGKVYAFSDAAPAVLGRINTSSDIPGVSGDNIGPAGNAVLGEIHHSANRSSAIYGVTNGTGVAVHGYIPATKIHGGDNDNTSAAVYGKNESPHVGENPGVKGESLNYGVVGTGAWGGKFTGRIKGVEAEGNNFGGTFKALATDLGVGVKGESSGTNGKGVEGTASGSGGRAIYGLAVDRSGIAIEADNPNSGGVALKVTGAIQAGGGIRKLEASTKIGTWSPSGDILMADFGNDSAGIVKVPPGSDCAEVQIRTTAVKSTGSLVLISQQGWPYETISLGAEVIGIGVISIKPPVHSSQRIHELTKIGWLVIN